MSLKRSIKHAMLGSPGPRPRDIRRGLLRGLRFEVDTDSKSMRLLGLDEREIAPIVREFGLEARTAIDVGSNDGWYSLFFASLANMQKVLACEPDGALQRKMMENLSLNNAAFRDKVVAVEKFIGMKSDDPARWCTIDSLREHMTPPVVLKIDVDGGEVEVLRSARQTLTELSCTLVVETHSADLERECLASLEPLGYTARVIDNAWYRAILPERRTDNSGVRLPHNRWFAARSNARPGT